MQESTREIRAGRTYRVDRIEDVGSIGIEAVRIDLSSYAAVGERGEMPTRAGSVTATPVFAVFLDLPLLRGDEAPQAPHVAIASDPWPGSVTVWSSTTDAGYLVNTNTDSPAILGVSQTELFSATPGLWDRGSVLRILIPSGKISSASTLDVLNGANVAAIGDGSSENWEILQFSEAALVGEDLFELKVLLRGLAGSDATSPASWPVGSMFVLLDGLVPQMNLPLAARGLDRFYRIGASNGGYADSGIKTRVEAFNGVGLRPYSVSHIAQKLLNSGNLFLSWIRRTRIDGDSWQSIEVPLSEEKEYYTVRVVKDNSIVRDLVVSEPSWTYTQAMQLGDAISTPFLIKVAQNSITFGTGPFKSISIL